MLKSIEKFRNVYGSRYSSSIREFLSTCSSELITYVESALATPRSTIYIFGNGGSYAISKCLKYAIEDYASMRGFKVRIETGIDVNNIDILDERENVGFSFTKILEREGADERDLIILISGSGDSNNLCKVAQYSRKISIPTLAFIGSKNGKITQYIEKQSCFITPIHDQQISEDIIQSLCYGFELDLKNLSEFERGEKINSLAKKLEKEIQQFPAELLNMLANKIVNSFQSALPIWVIGVGHSSINVCAEHTAHNLYWDGIFEITNPPHRFIYSTATSANLSGISNDRKNNVASHLMGFEEIQNGIAIIYASSYDRVLQEIIKNLSKSKIASYLIFSKGVVKNDKVKLSHKTNIDSEQVQAGIAQVFGHILGRIVRMKLLKQINSSKFSKNKDVSDFLITQDLAQRRLLDE